MPFFVCTWFYVSFSRSPCLYGRRSACFASRPFKLLLQCFDRVFFFFSHLGVTFACSAVAVPSIVFPALSRSSPAYSFLFSFSLFSISALFLFQIILCRNAIFLPSSLTTSFQFLFLSLVILHSSISCFSDSLSSLHSLLSPSICLREIHSPA